MKNASIPPTKMQTTAEFFGAVTDWLGIAAMWHLTAIQVIGPEIGAAAIVGLATGTIVSKIRGKIHGSTVAALLLSAPVVAKLVGLGIAARG